MSQIQTETLSCSVCLELLKEPVTVPCGHSYCKTCISSFWDGEKEKEVYSCPQCREMFTPRPVLMKNTMLAELVEHQSAALKRHRLVDPSKKLQENICSHHQEVLKMFCRTDQQCICFLCSVEEHKGHDMVSAAAEHTEKQRELLESQSDIHENIQDRDKDLQLLEEQLKSIKLSADHTLQHSQQMITDLIRVLHRRSSELEKEVRSKQQNEESTVRALQEKLQQEISDLKKRDAELQQISTTEDHIQFVLSYSSLSALSVSKHSSITHTHPHSCFQELTEHLHSILMEDWTKVCGPVERVQVLQPPEPTSRAEFLQYSQEISLDTNTAQKHLRLSEVNRKITFIYTDHYHHHQDRFTGSYHQVLSRESLTGRSYWEVEVKVEVRGEYRVGVAVSYKSISRDCVFGSNDKSWMLACYANRYTFYHNNINTDVSGVYVDHTADTLSFYSVSDTMTLLHRVNTTFTEPLHAGIYIDWFSVGSSAEFCKL